MKIILVGIYRKESIIISRLIQSCKSIIDGFVCSNTENTEDDMSNEIIRVCNELKLPFKISYNEWVNFGVNRTISYKVFQEFIKEKNWDPATTYALLLDADMCLNIKPTFNKNKLKEAMYQVIQKNPSIEYYNVRLIRGDVPAICISVTHEYWGQDESNGWKSLPVGQLEDLEILDYNDGQYKGMKFDRDIKLLTQGLIDEPGNVRYMFYLGQSYKDIGKFEEAIKYYRQRFDAGGWSEERWYALFMIGACYVALNNFPKAIEAYLDAYDFYPRRSENLQALALQYRLKGKNQLAYMIAKKGLEIPYPTQDVLFIGKPVYDYLLKVEISISAYYVGKKLEGFLACNDLILSKKVPEDFRSMAHRNIVHYIDPVKIVSKMDIGNILKIPLLNEKKPGLGTFRPMNPSIIQTKQGYLVNIRCVSYRQKSGVYEYPDGTNQIRTKNILLRLDKTLKVQEQFDLIDPNAKDCSTTVFGLEDLRLFELKGNICFTCSTHLTCDIAQMTMCTMSNFPVDGKYQVVSKKLLIGPKGEQSCEKNWMPLIQNNHLYLIYSHDPLIKLHYNENSSKGVDISDAVEMPCHLDFLRGSGILLPFEDGFISAVHEVTFNDKRIYLHRFITYDKKLVPKKLSLPFYFFDKDVEYVCSLCYEHGKKNLILGLGVGDSDAYLVRVSIDYVKSMLMDLPNE